MIRNYRIGGLLRMQSPSWQAFEDCSWARLGAPWRLNNHRRPWCIQGGPKSLAPFFQYALTLLNINRFSKLFQSQEKICNNTITKDPTTPQVCRYTTVLNVSVLKATTENKTTSASPATTRFKKLTTGNNVFIVSVIVTVTSCRYYSRVAQKTWHNFCMP